jgi:hypothetical protein
MSEKFTSIKGVTLPYTLQLDRTRFAKCNNIAERLDMMLRDLNKAVKGLTFKVSSIRHTGDPETDCVNGVLVVTDTDSIGRIEVGQTYRAKESGRVDTYEINSERLKKRYHTITTKDYRKALRTAIEICAPLTATVVIDRMISDVGYKVSSVSSSMERNLEHPFRYNVEGLPAFICAYHEATLNKTPPPLLPVDVVNKIPANWKTLVESIDIAKNMATTFNAGEGAIVYKHETCMVVAYLQHKSLCKITSTYELPVEYQDKLAMLKIMGDSQPVRGIGVRFDEGTKFYLMPGPVPTHS